MYERKVTCLDSGINMDPDHGAGIFSQIETLVFIFRGVEHN